MASEIPNRRNIISRARATSNPVMRPSSLRSRMARDSTQAICSMSGGSDAHRLADVGERRGSHRAGLVGARRERPLEGLVVCADRAVALLHRLELGDDRLADRRLEVAVAARALHLR